MGEATPTKKEPTAAEAMFFYAIVKHTRNKADIDWNAVAEEQGFKNADVAKVRFGQVKRKLGFVSDTVVTPKKNGSASAGTTPTKVTKTPAGRTGTKGKARGGKVKKEEKHSDDDTPEATPVKDEKSPDVKPLLEGGAIMNDDQDPF